MPDVEQSHRAPQTTLADADRRVVLWCAVDAPAVIRVDGVGREDLSAGQFLVSDRAHDQEALRGVLRVEVGRADCRLATLGGAAGGQVAVRVASNEHTTALLAFARDPWFVGLRRAHPAVAAWATAIRDLLDGGTAVASLPDPPWLGHALAQLVAGVRHVHRADAERLTRVPAIRRATQVDLLRRLERARNYVADTLGARRPGDQGRAVLSLSQIARVACVSPFHLSRVFHDTYGEGLIEFVTRSRLTRARTLLLTTDAAVAHVGATVGFANPSAFTRAYRRRFGCTPTVDRAGARQPGDDAIFGFASGPVSRPPQRVGIHGGNPAARRSATGS